MRSFFSFTCKRTAVINALLPPTGPRLPADQPIRRFLHHHSVQKVTTQLDSSTLNSLREAAEDLTKPSGTKRVEVWLGKGYADLFINLLYL